MTLADDVLYRVPVRCCCGAYRKLDGYRVEWDGLIRALSPACAKCGSTKEPEMEDDPCG